MDGIAGFRYNNTTYLFRKNIQGDVTHIYTEGGTLVGQYAYDAWGNCATLQDTNGIATLNPFRYRGYYFDQENDLYYLQSRYYDPETCRFVNADDISYLDPETIGGLNLYAYCGNNPVIGVDYNGHFALGTFLIGLAVSWIISSIASYYLGQHLVSGATSLYGGIQTIATGISLFGYGPIGWVLGGIAIVAGAINIAFGTAEIQQHFTGNNWINAIGISGKLYNGLYVGAGLTSLAVSIGGISYMKSSAGQLAHEIQKNAKYWDKGTFKTQYGSLKYHFETHANGLSPTQYTQYALSFSSFNSSSFSLTYNYKYGNATWYFKNMFGVGGYFTDTGKIITFWF